MHYFLADSFLKPFFVTLCLLRPSMLPEEDLSFDAFLFFNFKSFAQMVYWFRASGMLKSAGFWLSVQTCSSVLILSGWGVPGLVDSSKSMDSDGTTSLWDCRGRILKLDGPTPKPSREDTGPVKPRKNGKWICSGENSNEDFGMKTLEVRWGFLKAFNSTINAGR